MVALVLRAFLLFAAPQLSGDVYRYLSDGRVTASGQNPYEYTPTDPRINHREIRSIYPPHAQLLFALVHQLTAWRLLIIAIDVAAIALLRRDGFAYATFPLLLFEGTWSGHIDAIAGALVLVALLHRSGVAAGLASGLKLIPIAAVPALLLDHPPTGAPPAGRHGRQRLLLRERTLWASTPLFVKRSSAQQEALPAVPARRRRHRGWVARDARFGLAFAFGLALPVIPFLGHPIMPGLRDYATRWTFNSPVYAMVFAVVERIPTKAIWTSHPFRTPLTSDWVYRHVDPQFVTRVVLAAIALGLIAVSRRVSTSIAALLLCSPTIHPWYWLALAPSSLVESTSWIYFALLAPLSYLLYDGAHPLLVYALCYGLGAGVRLFRA